MSRIRYLKPEFFLDEDVAELSFPARLLFQGLWVLADREGRLEDRPSQIRVRIFPYDVAINAAELLDELAKPRMHSFGAFIVRYTVGDQKFIQINNFKKHQKVHHKEAASTLPAPASRVKVRASPLKKIPSPGKAGANPSGNGEWGMGNGELEEHPQTPKGGSDAVTDPPSDPVAVVFDHWREAMKHPEAKLTPERRAKIRARLDDGYTAFQLLEAVDGCAASPFNMGDNEHKRVYDDLTLICRNGSKVEQFRARVSGAPKARDEPGRLLTPAEWEQQRREVK